MNPGIKIRSEKAKIETLQVTIKSIRVEKKQMTLAVFRQIPEADIFNDDGTINEKYSFWGIVRYSFQNSGAEWVVVSYEGLIYKACIDIDKNEKYLERIMNESKLRLEVFIKYKKDLLKYRLLEREYLKKYKLWVKMNDFLRHEFWSDKIFNLHAMSFDERHNSYFESTLYDLISTYHGSENIECKELNFYNEYGVYIYVDFENQHDSLTKFISKNLKKYDYLYKIEKDYIEKMNTVEVPIFKRYSKPSLNSNEFDGFGNNRKEIMKGLINKKDYDTYNYISAVNTNKSKMLLQQLDQLFIAV